MQGAIEPAQRASAYKRASCCRRSRSRYSIGPAQGLFIAAIASIPQLVQARLQKGDFLPQIIRPRMAPPRMLRTHNEMTIHRYLLQSIRMYSLKRLIILRD